MTPQHGRSGDPIPRAGTTRERAKFIDGAVELEELDRGDDHGGDPEIGADNPLDDVVLAKGYQFLGLLPQCLDAGVGRRDAGLGLLPQRSRCRPWSPAATSRCAALVSCCNGLDTGLGLLPQGLDAGVGRRKGLDAALVSCRSVSMLALVAAMAALVSCRRVSMPALVSCRRVSMSALVSCRSVSMLKLMAAMSALVARLRSSNRTR